MINVNVSCKLFVSNIMKWIKNHNFLIIDIHNKMTHQQYKCWNKTFTYHSSLPSSWLSPSFGITTLLLSNMFRSQSMSQ